LRNAKKNCILRLSTDRNTGGQGTIPPFPDTPYILALKVQVQHKQYMWQKSTQDGGLAGDNGGILIVVLEACGKIVTLLSLTAMAYEFRVSLVGVRATVTVISRVTPRLCRGSLTFVTKG